MGKALWTSSSRSVLPPKKLEGKRLEEGEGNSAGQMRICQIHFEVQLAVCGKSRARPQPRSDSCSVD